MYNGEIRCVNPEGYSENSPTKTHSQQVSKFAFFMCIRPRWSTILTYEYQTRKCKLYATALTERHAVACKLKEHIRCWV